MTHPTWTRPRYSPKMFRVLQFNLCTILLSATKESLQIKVDKNLIFLRCNIFKSLDWLFITFESEMFSRFFCAYCVGVGALHRREIEITEIRAQLGARFIQGAAQVRAVAHRIQNKLTRAALIETGAQPMTRAV